MPLLDLSEVTDHIAETRLRESLQLCNEGSPQWCIVSSCLRLIQTFSFAGTRTYPRPDHPDPAKRRPLLFMLVGILVSLRTTLENEQRAMGEVLRRYPTEIDLRAATIEDLTEAIQVAGMAEMRAKRIRKALDFVATDLNGSLEALSNLEMEEARAKLLTIPGVGPKAADCLLNIGLGMPSIAVDVNVFRVTSWLFALPWQHAPNYNNSDQVLTVKKLLDEAIPADPLLCQIVHTLFLLYGKSCRSNHPTRGKCMLREYCLTCIDSEEYQMDMPLFNDL